MSVTWDFYETECVAGGGGSCVLPPQPFVLASLTLPGPDSSGSAVWDGNGGYPEPPVYTGDTFSLAWPGMAPGVSQAFTGTPGCQTLRLCDFDITWSEVAGHLNAVSVTIDGFIDGIDGLGLISGRVETMLQLGGCNGTCEVSGYWTSGAVPEPASITLLLVAVLALVTMRINSWKIPRKLQHESARSKLASMPSASSRI